MSDSFSQEQLQKILEQLTHIAKNTGNGKNTSGYKNSGNQNNIQAAALAQQSKLTAAAKSSTDAFTALRNSSSNAVTAFNKYTSSVNGAVAGFESLAKVLGAGAFASQVAATVKETVKTYQDLTNVGQSFNGSMLQMQLAASNAALPLDEFARVVKQNSLVIAATGTKSFLDLNKSLRGNLMQMGMLGLSTSQLNDFMGEYLETQRLYGTVNNLNTDRAAKSLSNLAIETTKVANLTGKSRDEITKTAQNALRDESLRAKMLQMSSSSSEGFNDSLQKAMVYMAGLPKVAGDTLSRMLAQSVGRGSTMLTDDMQTFIDAGLFGVNSLIDGIKAKVDNGTVTDQDLAQFNKDFVAEGMKNMAALQFQASTGNAAAKQTIAIISEMKSIAEKTPEALSKQKRFTEFLTTLEETLNRLSGDLKTKFLTGLGTFMDGVENFIKSPAFDALSKRFGELASQFGAFIERTFTPEKLESLGNSIAWFAEKASEAAVTISKIIDPVATAFGKLTDQLGLVGAILATYIGYRAVKSVGGSLIRKGAGALGEKFNIGGSSLDQFAAGVGSNKALRVVIAGGSAGGGNDWSDAGGPEEKGKGGKGKAPKPKGRFGKLMSKLPSLGKLSGIASLGLGAFNAYSLLKSDASKDEKAQGLGGIVGGTALGTAGAWAGGALGGLLGGFGAIPGAMLGGYLGNMAGDYLGSKAVGAVMSDSSSNVVTPGSSPIPAISTDNMTSQISELQKAQQRTQQENADLKAQLNKLLDIMAQNGMANVAGLRDMVEETKKSNRNLETISGTIM